VSKVPWQSQKDYILLHLQTKGWWLVRRRLRLKKILSKNNFLTFSMIESYLMRLCRLFKDIISPFTTLNDNGERIPRP